MAALSGRGPMGLAAVFDQIFPHLSWQDSLLFQEILLVPLWRRRRGQLGDEHWVGIGGDRQGIAVCVCVCREGVCVCREGVFGVVGRMRKKSRERGQGESFITWAGYIRWLVGVNDVVVYPREIVILLFFFTASSRGLNRHGSFITLLSLTFYKCWEIQHGGS